MTDEELRQEIDLIQGLEAEGQQEMATFRTNAQIKELKAHIARLQSAAARDVESIRTLTETVESLREDTKVDGRVFNQGRAEGQADITVLFRRLLDPKDVNHWGVDGCLLAVARLQVQLKATKEACDIFEKNSADACELEARVRKLEAENQSLKHPRAFNMFGYGEVQAERDRLRAEFAAIRAIYGLKSDEPEAIGITLAEYVKSSRETLAKQRDEALNKVAVLTERITIARGQRDEALSQVDGERTRADRLLKELAATVKELDEAQAQVVALSAKLDEYGVSGFKVSPTYSEMCEQVAALRGALEQCRSAFLALPDGWGEALPAGVSRLLIETAISPPAAPAKDASGWHLCRHDVFTRACEQCGPDYERGEK